MKRICVDAAKCSGCRFCEMICSFGHEGKFSTHLSRITVIKEDKHGLDYPVLCHQCDVCPPISVCPADALKRNELGVINVNKDACTGCGSCVGTCMFHALKLDKSSKPFTCDLCRGKPICVERCPTKALTYEESETAMSRPEDAFAELLKRWNISG